MNSDFHPKPVFPLLSWINQFLETILPPDSTSVREWRYFKSLLESNENNQVTNIENYLKNLNNRSAKDGRQYEFGGNNQSHSNMDSHERFLNKTEIDDLRRPLDTLEAKRNSIRKGSFNRFGPITTIQNDLHGAISPMRNPNHHHSHIDMAKTHLPRSNSHLKINENSGKMEFGEFSKTPKNLMPQSAGGAIVKSDFSSFTSTLQTHEHSLPPRIPASTMERQLSNISKPDSIGFSNSSKINEIAQRAYNVFMFNTRDMEKNLLTSSFGDPDFDIRRAFQWCE